jgi:hypothetical protein
LEKAVTETYYQLPAVMLVPNRPGRAPSPPSGDEDLERWAAEANDSFSDLARWAQQIHSAIFDSYIPQTDRIENMIMVGTGTTERPAAIGSRRFYYDLATRILYLDVRDGDTEAWEVVFSSEGAIVVLDTSNFGKVLSASDGNLQDAMDTIDDHIHAAEEITVDVAGFGGILGALDDEVQHALDTLDDLQHSELPDAGTYDHGDIDNHIDDASIHFLESSIAHGNIQDVGFYTHYEIDEHIDDATIHFLEGDISHLNIQDIGVHDHADIDSHLYDLDFFHDHENLTGLDDDDHPAYLLASDATDRATFAASWTDLTDGGETTLHIHDARYYTETEIGTLLTGYLPLTAGSTKALTGDLYIDSADTPSVYLREGASATAYAQVYQDDPALCLESIGLTAAEVRISPKSASGGGACGVKLFADTTTTASSFLGLYDPDGSGSTLHHFFECSTTGDVGLCQQGGDVEIGSSGNTSNLDILSIQNPSLYLREAASAADYVRLVHKGNGVCTLESHSDGTPAVIDFSPLSDDNTSDAYFRFFRDLNTTGTKNTIWYTGNGVNATRHSIIDNDVNLCLLGGELTVGSTASNGVLIDPVNGIYLYGSAIAWDDLRFPALDTKLGGSKDPGFAVFKTNGAGSQGVFLYWFDKNTEEELYFVAQLPHRWAQGTDLEVHCHWVPAATAAGAGTDVCWGLEYTWVNINGTFGNTALIYGDEQSNGATETLTAGKHYLTELGTISGTGKTLSSMLVCRIFRDAGGTGGTDDYDDDAGLLEVDFHIQIDSFGSDDEYAKGP